MVWPATVAIGIGVGRLVSPDGDSMLFVEALIGQGKASGVM